MFVRFPLAVLCASASLGVALARPVQPEKAPLSVSGTGAGALQPPFDKVQQVVRAGHPAFEVRIVEGRSFFAQRNDGVVRLPQSFVSNIADPTVLNAMALIGLSYATHRPQEVPQLSRTAKILTGVAGFVGRNIAENEAARAGAKPSDLLAQPVVNNPDRIRDPQNPMVRGVIWAKATGACEASIVAALKSMARQDRDVTLRRDAVAMLRAMGSAAWAPDDRCLG